MYKVGQKVRIDYIASASIDETLNYFIGLEGTITTIYNFGQMMVTGPWGGIAITPSTDKVTVID